MSFTDQKPRIVTKEDLTAAWSGYRDGSHFYCSLCGTSFKEGDIWRWVYAGKKTMLNFMVCSSCDNGDVLGKWVSLHAEWDELANGKFRFIATVLRDWQGQDGQG